MPDSVNENVDSQEVESIKIGDEEFTTEELESLVQKGKLAREIEQKQNTSLDKVYPEYTKSRQQLKEREEEIERLKAEKTQETRKPSEDGKMTPEELRQQFAQIGVVTQDNILSMMETYLSAKELVKTGIEIESKGNPFESEDLPKFDSKEIFDYMTETGIKDPTTAYKVKYDKEIEQWRQKELNKSKPRQMQTDTTDTGHKQPPKVNITPQNLSDQIKAAMRGEI